ncbi:hypothetical protein BCT67_04045 [Vibrio breoganii]|nr:hypothetical protein BCT67_04045 [Vibrio breoganii]
MLSFEFAIVLLLLESAAFKSLIGQILWFIVILYNTHVKGDKSQQHHRVAVSGLISVCKRGRDEIKL